MVQIVHRRDVGGFYHVSDTVIIAEAVGSARSTLTELSSPERYCAGADDRRTASLESGRGRRSCTLRESVQLPSEADIGLEQRPDRRSVAPSLMRSTAFWTAGPGVARSATVFHSGGLKQ
jgi:hypothetical protein